MEQGTGKTRTTLEIISRRMDKGKIDYVLWLCPCSVKQNLKEDIIRHTGERLDNIIIQGIESISSSDRLYLELITLIENHPNKMMLIVDESNLCKNKRAIRTQRIIELAQKCRYRMILNGTPVSRTEADMWAQWYILDWRVLGYQSFHAFAADHIEFYEVKVGGVKIKTNRVRRVLDMEYLAQKIAPYTYQITKQEAFENGLPEKQYCTRYGYMTGKQAQVYEETKERFLMEVDDFDSTTIYRLFTSLQHTTSGRRVISGVGEKMKTENIFNSWKDNPRIQTLKECIKNDIEDEQCIIFTKFQQEIEEIKRMLDEMGKGYVEFTGAVNQEQRQKNRKRFKDGEVQFFLSNKTCGAYGLNLQFCRNIIFYNNDWDYATRSQAEDRIHRLGQDRECYIYSIVMSDTIDERIVENLSKKDSMVESFKSQIEKWKNAEAKDLEEAGQQEDEEAVEILKKKEERRKAMAEERRRKREEKKQMAA
jgi:SNF2 family DNA or RNA helicase